jgi:hypothetical protein
VTIFAIIDAYMNLLFTRRATELRDFDAARRPA